MCVADDNYDICPDNHPDSDQPLKWRRASEWFIDWLIERENHENGKRKDEQSKVLQQNILETSALLQCFTHITWKYNNMAIIIAKERKKSLKCVDLLSFIAWGVECVWWNFTDNKIFYRI